jgi:hypothetical protein
MSFLDEQATGQIGIGEKANLSTLTRRKRKRKKGQAPTGSETYSLMPQDEFSNIVSSPTDIQQVGIGNLLQAPGSSAGEVPNVFKEYDSAAPLLGTKEAVYYQPPPDDDDDPGDDNDLPSIEDDPMRNVSPDTGIDDPFSPNFQGTGYGGTATIGSGTGAGQTLTQNTQNVLYNLTGGTLGKSSEETRGDNMNAAMANETGNTGIVSQTASPFISFSEGEAMGAETPGTGGVGHYGGGSGGTTGYGNMTPAYNPKAHVTPVTPVTPYDPGSIGAPDAPSGGSDISIPGYSGSTSDFGLD